MKRTSCFILILAHACFLFCEPRTFADTLRLLGDRVITGTVLQTNTDNVLLLADYGTLNCASSIIKEIKIDQAEAVQVQSKTRLPDFRSLILLLSKQPWATNLKQIPATVIDKGVLKNVPYVSFRCGEDYEVNVYGDLDRPAGIEVGLYRKLLNDQAAKANCLRFFNDILGNASDRKLVQQLSLEKDVKVSDGITFEITPPSAEDAYLGWWASAYSEAELNQSRASNEELKQITTATSQTPQNLDFNSWSAAELKLRRQAPPKTISFRSPSGWGITNATVVRVIDGVSLIWRDETGGGVVQLADLPEDLRTAFGYDPEKAKSAEAAAEAAKAAHALQAQALAPQTTNSSQGPQASSVAYASGSTYTGGGSGDIRAHQSTGVSSGRDRVYVRSYTRKDGTYVQPHTRSYPHRR